MFFDPTNDTFSYSICIYILLWPNISTSSIRFLQFLFAVSTSSSDLSRASSASSIFGSKLRFLKIKDTHLRFVDSFKFKPSLQLKASKMSLGMTQDITNNKQRNIEETENSSDLFNEMKQRFLSFKKHKYLENLKHFQNLAEAQAPKFMVIACGDSRVCPSNILGFQPGEAFVVRNVANLVPSFENGPSETNAALEFAVNSVGVENILVIGHSRCGGIRALMSMQDEVNSSRSNFLGSWVVVGKNARLRTKAAASGLSLDQQCKHCEKESINRSLLNLLTYPWIKERVMKGILSIHGGYYDFVDCTFEKWTLDYQGNDNNDKSSKAEEYSIKNREFWC